MSIVLHVKSYIFTESDVLKTLSQFGASVLDVSADEWNSTLKGQRDAILKSLLETIPNADVYRDIMLNRALPAYQSYVNPNHPKYNKAIIKFKAKQSGAYNAWNAGVTSAFAEGGRFEARVDETKTKWRDRTLAVLRIVGARPLGLGPAPKVMLWLSGDRKVLGLRNTTYDVVWEGEPTNVFDPNLPFNVRQNVIPVIVEGLYYAILFDKAGDTANRNQTLSDYSTKFQTLLARLIDSSKYVVDIAQLAYDTAQGNFYVEVQISRVSA